MMTLFLVLAGLLVALVATGVLVIRAARRGIKRAHIVTMDGTPVTVLIYTGHWFGRLVPMTGVTIGPRIYLDHPGIRADRGPVTTARMVAHELVHVEQARRLGWRYLPTYLLGRLTSSWKNHPMEVEANQRQAGILAGTDGRIQAGTWLTRSYPTRGAV